MNTQSAATKEFKEKSSVYKMEYKTKTATQLRLRKADLMALLSSAGPTQNVKTEHESDLLDAPVPVIDVPTLTPGKYTPPSNTWKSSFSGVLEEVKNKVRSKLNTFSDWLINYIAPQEK